MIVEVLLPTLSWLVATLLVGAAVFPLGCRALRPLPDAGAGFVPIVGPLLLAYLTWLPGMLGLVELRTSTLVVILTVLATSAWRWAGRDALEVVLESIRLAQALGFEPVKVNAVVNHPYFSFAQSLIAQVSLDRLRNCNHRT